jgi:uncharacterized membrane protein
MSPNPFRHWLLTLNGASAVFLAGALVAPALAALDWTAAAYHVTCHRWAFRSFFLFAPPAQPPVTDHDLAQLTDMGVDPFSCVGAPDVGWKMALCERDLAIYVGLLAVGVAYARWCQLPPTGFAAYAVAIAPMAVDGFTQLFGWRESTWELRVVTGLLFGLASAWLVLPRLDRAFGVPTRARRSTI